MNVVAPPALPVTWRPLLGRLIPYGLAVLVLGLCLLLAVITPSFRVADRAGFVALGLVIAAGLHFLARCRVSADRRGLTVVNLARTHRFDWAEVVDAGMAVGEPWPTLDLADGTTVAAMGIQAADGERARRAVAQLRALIREHGEVAEP